VRRRAGLSQRALAEKTGIPQSTIGRIESGAVDPRVSTLDALLAACDYDLETVPRLGLGVDRTQIRENLRLSREARLMRATREAAVFRLFEDARRKRRDRASA
jgi:transcriptional regulator with XRE-family HTH domain